MVALNTAVRLSILVVDSHEDCAISLAELLGLYGHSVTITRSVETALRVAVEDPPDVVILEPWLRGSDGWSAVRRIREVTAGVWPFVIAVTAGGMDSDRARSAEAGVDVHLVKPVAPGELRAVLEWHLAGLTHAVPDGNWVTAQAVGPWAARPALAWAGVDGPSDPG